MKKSLILLLVSGGILHSATLTWDPLPDSSGVVGYDVHYGPVDSNPTSHISLGQVTSVVVNASGQNYFQVTGRDGSGIRSGPSNQVVWTTAATPTPAPTPTPTPTPPTGTGNWFDSLTTDAATGSANLENSVATGAQITPIASGICTKLRVRIGQAWGPVTLKAAIANAKGIPIGSGDGKIVSSGVNMWCEVTLPSPVAVTAGTPYIVYTVASANGMATHKFQPQSGGIGRIDFNSPYASFPQNPMDTGSTHIFGVGLFVDGSTPTPQPTPTPTPQPTPTPTPQPTPTPTPQPTPPDTYPIADVTGLQQALDGLTDVKLTWDANTEPDLAGYKLHWGPVSGAPSQHRTLSTLTTTTVDSAELPIGVPIYFTVTAFNLGGGESLPSNEVMHIRQASSISDVIGLQQALDALQAQITAQQAQISGKAPTVHTHSWDLITGKPTTFPPASHTHPIPQGNTGSN